MAEHEENEDPASLPRESQTPTSPEASAATGHDEPVSPVDPLAALTPSGKELLKVSLDVLKDFSPKSGALNDIPQISVDKEHTLEACRLMKADPRIAATLLLCLAGVDYSQYFQLVYVLHSLEPERTVVLRTDVPYSDVIVPSVTSVWRGADWYEREAHDLFGVDVDGHPDLSPLLLYEGFEGFPGRREFPFNDYQEF